MDDKKTDMKLVKDFFFPGVPAKEFMEEWKQLNEQDRKDLGEGIRNGTLNY